ncbi:PCNA-interacting partner isoform X1 [Columba livia]|uniref:PCNA-interacting partner n=1 Tax=Columba livia TaxID=8932 RepID=A0A2I0MK46_COLLI|nr:PCNA-interacting partner isoform X1 [Columba livia]PKK30049.1 PARP1 binding protein [Columba livia]
MIAFQQKILNLIKCFRRQWPLFSNSDRTTVCGADCMLMALQLSMAEVNKQHHGDFTVSLSDVLETWKYLLHDKLGLSYENMKEPENYGDLKKAYDAFLARSNMLDLIDICQKCSGLGLISEDESIAPVQLLEFISGMMNIQENNGSVLSTPTSVNRQGQENVKVAILARKCVCSYLSLLVNSKDDLALAHILNVPDRGLGREAFTTLKHASQKIKMSIFLMATSFIRTVELGGRGCSSSLFDPLKAHVKGLSNFVNFIDKLQEIVGEILNPRISGGRILSTVKMHLIKGRSNGDPFCQAVEEVVEDLDLKIKNIIGSQHEVMTASTTGVSPARPKLHSINHGTAYCGRDTVKVLLVLLDEEAVNPPTQNKGELLYDDENLNLFGITSVLTLFRSPAQSSDSSPKPLRQRIQKSMDEKKKEMKQSSIKSQFACTYKNELSERNGQQFLSSNQIPTCMHPALKRRLKAGYLTEGMNSSLDVPVLGTISENVQQTRSFTEMRKLSCQPRNKNSKNEQMDLNNDKVICGKENEPFLKKNAKRPKTSNNPQEELDSKISEKRKRSKTSSKNKLIAGQAKLTDFFHL